MINGLMISGWIWWSKAGLDPVIEHEDPVVGLEFLGFSHPKSGNFGLFWIKLSLKTQNQEILMPLEFNYPFPKNPELGNFGIKFPKISPFFN